MIFHLRKTHTQNDDDFVRLHLDNSAILIAMIVLRIYINSKNRK